MVQEENRVENYTCNYRKHTSDQEYEDCEKPHAHFPSVGEEHPCPELPLWHMPLSNQLII